MTALMQKEHVAQLSATRLVPFYLMASYTYYHQNDVFMSDGAYDYLCNRLQREWTTVNHPHKYLIDRTLLQQTTGYRLKQTAYPLVVRIAAQKCLGLARQDADWSQITPAKRAPVVVRTRKPVATEPKKPQIVLVRRRPVAR